MVYRQSCRAYYFLQFFLLCFRCIPSLFLRCRAVSIYFVAVIDEMRVSSRASAVTSSISSTQSLFFLHILEVQL